MKIAIIGMGIMGTWTGEVPENLEEEIAFEEAYEAEFEKKI